MNEKDLVRKSKTDWDKLAAMNDEDIDSSDIPPLDDIFYRTFQSGGIPEIIKP